MIKKLDKLILKSFIGPFVITFFIAFFVLMMQGLWKYLDDLVGKGLDFITICQFLWYACASLLMLAMPIAILISSIMTFGNLGESFELVAIKSSGVSLLRFMRPLIWMALLLCGITFLFANYVIPYANLKFTTLYSDIYVKKPAFDLKEGVFFTHIPNYAIKIGKKDSDGRTIHNIIIFEQNNSVQDNCIVAEKGVMKISDDEKYLEFNLENGFRYQERGNLSDTSTEYTRLGFKEFKKLFDLSVLQKQQTNDSIFSKNFKMLSARQLSFNIDSLKKDRIKLNSTFNKIKTNELIYSSLPDKIWKQSKPTIHSNDYKKLFTDSINNKIKQYALNKIASIKSGINQFNVDKEVKEKDISLHLIEWHRKYAISLACLILFFIGAPLGAIIRKGGLGMPLVVAIVFFLIFHLLSMFGEKFVKQEILSPALGMWLAIIVLSPVGAFLTYKAMHDSQLFNKEFYTRQIKKLKAIFKKNNQSVSYE
jgi:lipopolysaccharide export system permease protein